MTQQSAPYIELSQSLCPPSLSVVVASVHSNHHLEDLLSRLEKQGRDKQVEIIVVHCQNEFLDHIKAKNPDVKFIQFTQKTSLPLLWGAGIARSTGEIIAITDTTCVVEDDWVEAVLKAHRTSLPVIGGAVETAGSRRWVDWAAYFCEYGQFMRPLREGLVKEAPGNNISFKRWVLHRGQEFIQNGFWKTFWCQKLQEEGIQLLCVPSIIVYDKKSYHFKPFLIRRFHHGRCFAGMRAAQASIVMRMYFFVGSPLLPLILLKRTVASILPKKRYLKEFLLSLPISVLAILAWSIGEFCGNVMGPGKSSVRIY